MRADDRDSSSNYFSISRSKLQFLGAEFLTWLYFYIDQMGGQLPLAEIGLKRTFGEGTLRIAVGKRIVLTPLLASDCRVNVQGPMLDDSGEVLSAIRTGAYVQVLALDVVIAERIYSFTLHASDGAITLVKVKLLFDEKNNDALMIDEEGPGKASKRRPTITDEELVLLRMSSLDEIEDLIDALFGKFLSRRLGQAFIAEDIKRIRSVVATGLENKVPSRTQQIPSEIPMVSVSAEL